MSSPKSATLIDRDELLATLEQDINVSVTGEENMEAVRRCLQEILDDVKESPVVDAVRVVRCRDCKHYREPNEAVRSHYCWYFCEDVDAENDYCSWAERRTDEIG